MQSLNLALTPIPTFLSPLANANATPTNPKANSQTPQADEMLALGSLGDQSKRIRQKLPKNVQTLFFSATWTETVTLALILALTDYLESSPSSTHTHTLPHLPFIPPHPRPHPPHPHLHLTR